jgi:hypothetical protein
MMSGVLCGEDTLSKESASLDVTVAGSLGGLAVHTWLRKSDGTVPSGFFPICPEIVISVLFGGRGSRRCGCRYVVAHEC